MKSIVQAAIQAATVVAGFMLLLVADAAAATTLPGEIPSIQVFSSQKRAEKAFDAGHYERAHWHYLKVLAPAGDKYAHYMLGHMNEHGLGVPRDPARALAWYALSAERKSDLLSANYRRLLGELDASQHAQALAIHEGLLERYGDRTLLAQAIKRDEFSLRMKTGTRTGADVAPMRILLPSGRTVEGNRYYDHIEERIEFRTQLLGGTVTLRELELIDEPSGTDSGTVDAPEAAGNKR